MAAVALGDIFIAIWSSEATFSTGGVYVSGERRARLWQISAAGALKEFWLLEYGELTALQGLCTDGTRFYGCIEATEFLGSPNFTRTSSALEIAADGTLTVHPMSSGGIFPAHGNYDTDGLITNGGGTFWALHKHGTGNPALRQYDASFALTGSAHPLATGIPNTPWVLAPFVSTSEALLIKDGADTFGNRYSDLYRKDLTTGTEVLVYSRDGAYPFQFLFGADWNATTGQIVVGQRDDTGFDVEVHQVVDGVKSLMLTYDPGERWVSEGAGLSLSPDCRTVYFATLYGPSPEPPNQNEVVLWSCPFGSGAASILWQSGLFTTDTDNFMHCGITVIKPPLTCAPPAGGRRRVYTTAVGIH